MVVMVMMMVVKGFFSINHALDGPKLLHVARNRYGSFLIEPKLFLRLLQKLQEQRVIEVNHRHHEPL